MASGIQGALKRHRCPGLGERSHLRGAGAGTGPPDGVAGEPGPASWARRPERPRPCSRALCPRAGRPMWLPGPRARRPRAGAAGMMVGPGAAGTCLLDPCCLSARALLCGAHSALCPLPPLNVQFPIAGLPSLHAQIGGAQRAGPGAPLLFLLGPSMTETPGEGASPATQTDPRGSAPASPWVTPSPLAGLCGQGHAITSPRIEGSPVRFCGSSEHSSVTTL